MSQNVQCGEQLLGTSRAFRGVRSGLSIHRRSLGYLRESTTRARGNGRKRQDFVDGLQPETVIRAAGLPGDFAAHADELAGC